jgi:chromatin structure-remodeling complex subunit RSC1/2
VEVYHLLDSANASIPPDIRAQFHRDEHDRVLFFTAPPIDASPIPKSARTLGHSIRYLAAKAREREAAKAASATSSRVTNDNPVPGTPTPEPLEFPGCSTARASASESGKDAPKVSSDTTRPKRKASEIEHENNENIKRLRDEALGLWCTEMQRGTELIYQQMHGDDWMAAMEETNQKLAAVQAQLKLRDNGYEGKRK